ncbi:MAG: tetratricopeptide repeat protein, partial [Pseudomonadota bacterium]
LVESNDFGAQVRTAGGAPTIHDHLFPAANTGIAHLLGFSEDVILKHQQMLEDSLRVDLVGVRKDGRIDGELIAPIRPVVPALEPGREYLLQAVIRTLTLGHMFTQGTSDSNEIWMAAEVRLNGELIGRSGGLDPVDGRVDPWSHFVNNWMLDRDGNRIDRRNAEDIFVPLYNHQIPPGAADVVHYRLAVPPAAEGELTVRLKLAYRKFDTTLMRHVKGETFVYNDLPITVMAEDMVTFPVGFDARPERQAAPDIPEWQRFNDYAIGALRKPERRQLRQAEVLFAEVEQRGMGVGALNLARVYLEEGRLDEAAEALRRARNHPNPPPAWSMAWFSGQLLFQQGQFEQALVAYNALAETQFSEARERGFDFSRDYRLLNQIGLTWLQIAQSAEAPAALDAQHQAVDWFARTLIEDPENTVAHYNLDLLYRQLGQAPRAAYHAAEYARYRIDDNARDRAIAAARRANPAANHAADPVVIYDLHRPDALQFSLPVRIEPNPTRVAQ